MPLPDAGRASGFLYADLDGSDGRWGAAELRSLKALATAAPDPPAQPRPDQRVAGLAARLDARERELAIIDALQRAVASEPDFQRIVDVVGDKLREVFATGDLSIRWWDEAADRMRALYVVEHGRRLDTSDPDPQPSEAMRRFIRERRTAVVGSIGEQEAQGIGTRPGTDQARSIVAVPMLAGERLLGAVMLEDHEHDHAFGPAEVRLLETIASSLGIALLNAKNYEAERQRSAELAVINGIQQGIAGQLNFQSIVELVGDELRELFAGSDIGIWWWDAERRLGTPLYVCERGERVFADRVPLHVPEGTWLDRTLLQRELVCANTVAEMDALDMRAVDGSARPLSVVAVPIVAGELVVGQINLENYEREHAWGPAEIRLLTTVTASLGTALHNARLFDEVQRRGGEAAALAEVGRDLSSSLDVATVMERIARHALELLGGDNAAIFLPEAAGTSFRAIVAVGDAAEAIRRTAIHAGVGIIGAAAASGRAEFVNDAQRDARGVPIAGTVEHDDERLIVAPLLAGDVVKGVMAVWRSGGSPFDQADLQFLVGLSQQAAVAIENARLFSESQQALERQTATAEVLQTLAGSMADAQPVFEKVLDSCQRLLRASHVGIFLSADGQLHRVAARGMFAAIADQAHPRPLAGSVSERVMAHGDVVHAGDIASLADLPDYVEALVHGVGRFALASAPMIWQGQGIGTLDIARAPAGPFSEHEIDLLRTFAGQAVIAIQNARLFNETKEALERQTAMGEILRVISQSPTDVQPVFDTIASAALGLCDASSALVFTFDGELIHLAANANVDPQAEQAWRAVFPRRPGRDTATARAILTGQVAMIPDALADPEYAIATVAAQTGFRSALSVPLVREGKPIGAIGVGRPEPGPFGEHQVAILKTFADQAVIAIE
ncbi:MAG TPA: GAF domain-containing protein, partial [Ideonella sp.]|nr:GAF domain-containing protein [Ideonella sp.]